MVMAGAVATHIEFVVAVAVLFPAKLPSAVLFGAAKVTTTPLPERWSG